MQIKWNEVTWYSRWAAVVVFLIGVLVLAFYIGVQYGEVKNTEMIPEVVVATTTKEIKTPSSPSGLSTYTNSIYNFTFQYPSTWTLTETADKKGVVIEAPFVVSLFETRKMLAFRTSFSVIPKTEFKSIGTKVGNISYDAQKKSLVDEGRCLPKMTLHFMEESVPAFLYGGSLMSTPAHFEYAILRNDDSMILTTEISEGANNDSEFQQIREGKNTIYSSFAFTGNVQAFVPECAPLAAILN